MDERNVKLASQLVDAAYIQHGAQSLRYVSALLRSLLSQRSLPDVAWCEADIEDVLRELSRMDSNNFPKNIGAGEREAKIVSGIVARRHFRLGHGVGRSGDIAAIQVRIRQPTCYSTS